MKWLLGNVFLSPSAERPALFGLPKVLGSYHYWGILPNIEVKNDKIRLTIINVKGMIFYEMYSHN